MQTILTVVGARPQFIKSAPVSLALKKAGIREIMVHTGQHYDPKMSDIFFEQLNMTPPDYNLEIGSGSHAYQTGEGLKGIETILETEKPDAVLVYGDTNATLSGALAAAKLHIPIAHVEAGLRSYNRRMPEEVNRVLTDHVSKWLFVPTQQAIENLAQEGITRNVHLVGDVMLDAVNLFSPLAQEMAGDLFQRFEVQPKNYLLLTMHRAETTDQPDQVRAILQALDSQEIPVLFPVHPRTREMVTQMGSFRNIRFIEPLSYFEMLAAEQSAKAIVTDSGGVQKEAAFFAVPCVTLRNETEWVETVTSGWNQLTGLSPEKLTAALSKVSHPQPIHELYGNGNARFRIVDTLKGSSSSSIKEQKSTVSSLG